MAAGINPQSFSLPRELQDAASAALEEWAANGKVKGFPELHVLDSTDPAQIKAVENKIDLSNTLFFVSSKSGTTLEPNIFKQYFFERVSQIIGDNTGDRFIAITDPGSKLRQAAES